MIVSEDREQFSGYLLLKSSGRELANRFWRFPGKGSLAAILLFGCLCHLSAFGQTAQPANQPTCDRPESAQLIPDALTLLICKGEGESHPAVKPEPKEIEVLVLNEAGVPQAQAQVSFMAVPGAKQPTIIFPGLGKPIDSGLSDENGRAKTKVLGNGVKGPFKIPVTAAFAGRTGTIEISQENLAKPFWTKRKRIAALAIGAGIGVGLGLGLHYALRTGPLPPPSATLGPNPISTTQSHFNLLLTPRSGGF